MAEPRPILIRVDDRMRLISAALSATRYPELAQQRQKHGVTLHARGTRKWLAEYADHPAVKALQMLLNRGITLEHVFGYGMRLTWPHLHNAADTPAWVPPGWNAALMHFFQASKLAEWWAEEDEAWQQCVRHLTEIFDRVNIEQFLRPFFGAFPESLVVLPNISYPTDQNVAITANRELIAIIPPRRAWGDSAPWPYDNDPVYVYQEALRAYIKLLLYADFVRHRDMIAGISERALPVGEKFAAHHPTWTEQMVSLLTAGLVALFLEEALDAREARAFVHMAQKVEGLSILSQVVTLLKRYQEEQRNGKYTALIEYLPIFVKQLRVARTLAAL
jgi:hypothetical protein